MTNRKQNNSKKAIKDKIIRDIANLFEQKEQNYYKSIKWMAFMATVLSNMKAVVIEIKPSGLKNTSIKFC